MWLGSCRPSARSMAAALLPRERPPLVVSENLQTIGPEGSIIVDDLRVFLLEVVAEPPRLRQDDEIFQNDLDRFLEALQELPASLMQCSGTDPGKAIEAGAGVGDRSRASRQTNPAEAKTARDPAQGP